LAICVYLSVNAFIIATCIYAAVLFNNAVAK
jgi:hypothetical protein